MHGTQPHAAMHGTSGLHDTFIPGQSRVATVGTHVRNDEFAFERGTHDSAKGNVDIGNADMHAMPSDGCLPMHACTIDYLRLLC